MSRLRLPALAVVAALGIPTAAQAAVVPANGNWGLVNRNIIGAATAQVRTGPFTPPYGPGSINFLVPSANDKMAYGNEVDFVGIPLSSITTLGFSVFTTGENAAINPANLPNLGIEIDPTGPASTTAPNYTTLVNVSTAAPVNVWSAVNASAGQWYLTGAAGTASNCNQMTYCTLAGIKAAYPAATLLAVQITKGRDYAWNGAVDGVVVNDTVYDLAPTLAPITSTGTPGTSGTPGPSGTTPVGGTGTSGASSGGVRCVSTRSVTLRRPKNARRSTATYVDRNGRRRTVTLSPKGTRISFSGRSVTKGAVTVVQVRDTVGRKTKSRTVRRTLC
jgi:hypothetical protein